MFLEEALWFGQNIVQVEADNIFPMCNVGSSSAYFRKEKQPWIDEHIFKPLREKNYPVKHLDIQEAAGIDIIGDLNDPCFLKELAAMDFKSIFCSNLLEHVPDPQVISEILVSVLPERGHLFVSAPFSMPYHPDPIDTMFRPTIDELAALFPGARIRCGEIVKCGTLVQEFMRAPSKSLLFKTILTKSLSGGSQQQTLISSPANEKSNGQGNLNPLRYMPWLFKRFKTTCLVLVKEDAGQMKRREGLL